MKENMMKNSKLINFLKNLKTRIKTMLIICLILFYHHLRHIFCVFSNKSFAQASFFGIFWEFGT